MADTDDPKPEDLQEPQSQEQRESMAGRDYFEQVASEVTTGDSGHDAQKYRNPEESRQGSK